MGGLRSSAQMISYELALGLSLVGVLLVSGGHRAVFLPQVATEQGWSRLELLENLSQKAGLMKGAWKRSSLSTFQATVFGEESAHGAA